MRSRWRARVASAWLLAAWALVGCTAAPADSAAASGGATSPGDASADASTDAHGSSDAQTGSDTASSSDTVSAGDTQTASDTQTGGDTASSGDGQTGSDTASSDGQANPDAAAAPPTTGVCFAALPSPATYTGAVPLTLAACSELNTPEWFFGQASVPPPSLKMQIGRRDAQGQWQPLQDGDWIGLETAMQGGFHLNLVPRVLLPGQTAAKLQLQTEAIGDVQCNPVANLNMAKAWLVAEPPSAGGGPGWYTTDATTQAFVIFGVSVAKKQQFCGLWVTARWRLRLPGTEQWGEVVRTLRTYDATGLP